jgi:glycosyltransferase involved in cell wall biosynthesis
VLVVARNEEAALPRLLADLAAQTYPLDRVELILVDSQSSDATRGLMEAEAKAARFHTVTVLDNPRRVLASGLNIGLASASGDAVLRLDAHAEIPPDFLRVRVGALQEGASVVGGPVRWILAHGTDSWWTNLLLVVETSALGSSPADYRRDSGKDSVSSVSHAMYRHQVFAEVGEFNEKLRRTEDNEFHLRVREAGYQIRYDPAISSAQHVRPTLRAMLKQKASNGYWVGLTASAWPRAFRPFHFVPLVYVLSLAGAVSVLPRWRWPLVGLLGAHFVALLASCWPVTKELPHRSLVILAPPLCWLIHVAYGSGTAAGLLAAIRRGGKRLR